MGVIKRIEVSNEDRAELDRIVRAVSSDLDQWVGVPRAVASLRRSRGWVIARLIAESPATAGLSV